jgi:hypothetical protein
MHGMAILAVAASIAVLAAAIQLVLPRTIARHAERRLTEHGGHARVHLKAFPAPILLRKRGASLTVKASGLVARSSQPKDNGGAGLDALDGFDSVDIQVIGVHVGPLAISRFHLERATRDEPYEATVQATVTGAELAAYAGGGRLGAFLTGTFPGARTEIPLDASATLTSDGGHVSATRVNGSVAGLPAGPLIEALVAAVAAGF